MSNRMRSYLSSLMKAFLISILFFPASYAKEKNSVLFWNDQALTLIRQNNVPPPKASRILGLMHVAVFEAVNSITRAHQPYDHIFSGTGSPSIVAEQAAASVLEHEFPQASDEISKMLKNRIGDGEGMGQEIAQHILRIRPLTFDTMESATPMAGYKWEPTAPQYAAYLLPEWCALKPLGISSAKNYRKSGPPKADSEEFQKAIDETMQLGSKDSKYRSADQTEIALFWADGKGTVTPPGHWNQIASQILEKQDASIAQAARVMALLNLALADAAIVAWDMKYKYQFSRPINMFEAQGWEPLIVTPPFPEYVSGHSTFSGAAAEVLTLTLGKQAFDTTSDAMPGVKRSFQTFEEAAIEAGRSRIYGGIHFSFSDEDGREAGKKIAKDIVQSYFKPRIDLSVKLN